MSAGSLTRRDLIKAGAAGVLIPGAFGEAAAAEGVDTVVFQNPGPVFRGVTLWMLNDRIDLDEAERQLRGFRDAGWGAVITRSFRGAMVPYMSPEWLRLTDRILEVSKQTGTTVFLQQADTDIVGGPVLMGMEERFRHRLLVQLPADTPPRKPSRLLAKVGGYAYYEHTVVPPGDAAKAFAVTDMMNPETVRAYIERSYEAQAKRYGKEFGKTVEAMWMDEPFIREATRVRLPVLPWTPGFAELFQTQWNYSILDHIPELFLQTGDYQKVRHQFWRTAVERFKKAYWEPVGQWCREHNVKFAGHLMAEDLMDGQIGFSGAIMPFYEDMQLPGIDYLTKDISTWRPVGSKFIMTPKQCSSVANQLGRPEALAEMYGVSDQDLTFEDRKWIAEWHAVLGITYRCYHGSFYSMRGMRKRRLPPHLSYQQPWYEENRRIADPMARVSYALRQGTYRADVLVVHPIESAHMLFSPRPFKSHDDPGQPELQAIDQALITLSDNLLGIHRGFDYGDEYLLAKYGKNEGNTLRVGRMQYRAVLLPGLITLRSSTVGLLRQFLDAGGLVASIGELPTRIDGAVDARIGEINNRALRIENSRTALRKVLDARLPAFFELAGAGVENIWTQERQAGKQRVIFLVNTSRSQTVEAELSIRGKGRLESWDIRTGKPRPVPQSAAGSQLQTWLKFSPTESHLLVLDETAPARPQKRISTAVARTVPLPRDYRLKRHEPNALTLDFCRYRLGEGAWSDPVPVIGLQEKLVDSKYQGPVEMQYRFMVKTVPASCELVVEDPDQCRIRVNGTEVRATGSAFYRDLSFRRIDVRRHVQAGENLVEVSRRFAPPDPNAVDDPVRYYGDDLEAVYIIGDFRLSDYALDSEVPVIGRDVVAAGYPFYAGRITLSQDIRLAKPSPRERVYVDWGELRNIVTVVKLNGKEAGAVIWAPYRVDVTELVEEGVNRLELDLLNSVRNLLGPHHYVGPAITRMDETSYTARHERRNWMELGVRTGLKSWTDRYQFVPFGVPEGARIVYEMQV